jgi:hypothetical protein
MHKAGHFNTDVPFGCQWNKILLILSKDFCRNLLRDSNMNVTILVPSMNHFRAQQPKETQGSFKQKFRDKSISRLNVVRYSTNTQVHEVVMKAKSLVRHWLNYIQILKNMK